MLAVFAPRGTRNKICSGDSAGAVAVKVAGPTLLQIAGLFTVTVGLGLTFTVPLPLPTQPLVVVTVDRKSVVSGKRADLVGRRIITKEHRYVTVPNTAGTVAVKVARPTLLQ